MLRKTGLFSLAAVLLLGCDLFSTSEFRSKPTEIRSLPGLAQAGDSIAYRVTESLWDPSAQATRKILSRRRMVFAFAGDSLSGSDTLKLLTLSVYDDSTGLLVEKSARYVRFTAEGIVVASAALGGGARYFPLKASAPAVPASASGPAASAAPDTTAFPTLPALLVQGWSEERALGVLTVRRRQTSIDTLKYQGHLEEAWGIRETVLDGDAVLGEGLFSYGVSGLLKADQIWNGFGWRDENGAPSGTVALRRALERL